MSRAEGQARDAGYTGVDLYVDAVNVPADRLLDFARRGALARIPGQGTIRSIYVRTADGWLLMPGGTP